MKLIARGVKKNNGQRESRFLPVPGTRMVFFWLAHRAPEQAREQRIFRQVSAFADEVMEVFDALLRKLRKQPVQKRLEDAGSMLGRMRVA